MKMNNLSESVRNERTRVQQNYNISDLAISILETYYNASYGHNPVKLQNNQGRIASLSKNEKASLPYPNPADTYLKINEEFYAGDKVEIYNSMGVLVYSIQIDDSKSELSINTASYANGLYKIVRKTNKKVVSSYNFSVLH